MRQLISFFFVVVLPRPVLHFDDQFFRPQTFHLGLCLPRVCFPGYWAFFSAELPGI